MRSGSPSMEAADTSPPVALDRRNATSTSRRSPLRALSIVAQRITPDARIKAVTAPWPCACRYSDRVMFSGQNIRVDAHRASVYIGKVNRGKYESEPKSGEAVCAECRVITLVETMHSTDGTGCPHNGLLCEGCFTLLQRIAAIPPERIDAPAWTEPDAMRRVWLKGPGK